MAGRKVFFSEEKKQKTFALWGVRWTPSANLNLQELFGSFFQDKTLASVFCGSVPAMPLR